LETIGWPISNIWRQNSSIWHNFKFNEFLCFLETIGWPISNTWRQNSNIWHKFKFNEFLCFLETIVWQPTHFKYMAPKFKYVTQLQIQRIFVLFGIHRLTPMHWKLASCMFIIQLYICRYMYVYTYIYISAQKASWNPSGDTFQIHGAKIQICDTHSK